MLTAWVLDLDDSSYPTLFDEHRAERAIAALDHNVFLDLHLDVNQRPQAKESRYLWEDWIADHAELCVTDEIYYEIYNHPNAQQRRMGQQWANRLRRISKPDDSWETMLEEVAGLAPKAGEADHRHVARAIVAGADYFVSRDADLLDAAEAIESAMGLVILQPAALIARLDKARADDPYQPAALAGTDLRHLVPTGDMHDEVISVLLNNAAGERRSELASRLRPILADRKNHEIQVVQAIDGQVVAGFARRIVDKCLEVSLIRVVPQHGSNAMARQLVFAQRKQAADLGLEEVQIVDPRPSKGVQEVLSREHFEENNDIWRSRVEVGITDVAAIDLQHPSPMTPAEYEDRYWPVKVVGAEVPSYIVPIKMAFAEELGLAEETLLPRQLGLGLDREHVYYRSVKNDRGIAPGARILWYVSGNAPAQPRGSIRAVSQVAEVVIGRPRTLHARFERFGIYSLEQVLERAEGTGEVMAIRFVNTEILERAIDLDELKAMWDEQGKKFVPPFSPVRIDEHMFCLLYKRSSSYA